MARNRFYYGWANLAVAALAMVATLPGRTQGLGLVTEPLLADLGLGRVDYAEINLWATLIGATFCLVCGRLLDRYGARGVLAVRFALQVALRRRRRNSRAGRICRVPCWRRRARCRSWGRIVMAV